MRIISERMEVASCTRFGSAESFYWELRLLALSQVDGRTTTWSQVFLQLGSANRKIGMVHASQIVKLNALQLAKKLESLRPQDRDPHSATEHRNKSHLMMPLQPSSFFAHPHELRQKKNDPQFMIE